jgi:methionyl-tRNA formyltransferase
LKIVFFGSGNFALPILEHLHKTEDIALVVTRPDSARDRGNKVKRSVVAQFCDDNNIDVCQPETINSTEAVQALKKTCCEIAVLASYSEILSPEVVSVFEKGIVNVHPSLLPLYRGAEPIRWPIRREEKETGSTMMLISSGLDRGNILLQKSIPILENDDYASLSQKLIELSNQMLDETLIKVDKGFTGQPQSQEKTFYARKLKPTDEIIDFSQSATKVSAIIRSMDPDPGVYCIFQGKRLKLFKPIVTNSSGKPGEVLEAKKKLVVACLEGSIEIGKVQPEGSKKMDSSSFLASGKLRVGDFLDVLT